MKKELTGVFLEEAVFEIEVFNNKRGIIKDKQNKMLKNLSS